MLALRAAADTSRGVPLRAKHARRQAADISGQRMPGSAAAACSRGALAGSLQRV